MRTQADSFPEFIFLFRMMKGTIVPVITVFFLSRNGRPLGLEKKQSWVASAFSFFMFFRPCRAIQPVSCRDFSFSRSCTYLMETAWMPQLRSIMQSPSRVFALSRKRGWASGWPSVLPGREKFRVGWIPLCYGKWRKGAARKKLSLYRVRQHFFELRKAVSYTHLTLPTTLGV